LKRIKKVFDSLKKNSNFLKASSSIQLINDDALNFIERIKNTRFDIIFLDPPFFKNYLDSCLSKIEVNQIIGKKSKIYIESEFEISDDFLKKNLVSSFELKKK